MKFAQNATFTLSTARSTVFPFALALLMAIPMAVSAEDDENDGAALDAGKLLADLAMANKEKDSSSIDALLKPIGELAVSSKNQKELDPIAKELSSSFKVCKGNWGTLKKIAATLGDLRSKSGIKRLKKLAFSEKEVSDDELGVQVAAIDAVGKYRGKREIGGLSDLTKHKNVEVAKAAYAAFKYYGAEKGTVRIKIVAFLMKRISLEYPASGGQGGKTVSPEKQARWRDIQAALVETLQGLCRQDTITTIDDWQEWWKENDSRRSKAWKDPKKKT